MDKKAEQHNIYKPRLIKVCLEKSLNMQLQNHIKQRTVFLVWKGMRYWGWLMKRGKLEGLYCRMILAHTLSLWEEL
ncbi:hypothetical protein RC54_24320 [Herbaspirillum rubrisubalbicans]|uniref:Uncharacterized protein n=1 Tax=Herbaspirillum rubrisubalbicans TaxID=80842 RepID=A0AAD0UB74_9BURK|nr:hypothetical protein RC54_24320 [Herbaspirillum rubrisubalbicans]